MELNEYLDRLANALIKDLERRQGKKLFTEEQLAEVAQEIETSYPFARSVFYEGANAPLIPDELYEFMDRRFAEATSRLESIVGGAVECPGAGGGRAIKFRRYKSFAPDAGDAPVYKNIIEAIRTLQHAAWENSKAHGWNEAVDNPASALMMITREVSELAEEERDASSGESTKIPGFSKKEEEAADIAIRLLSYCGARNMRLGAAICAKHEFNKTRPYRHGNKLF